MSTPSPTTQARWDKWDDLRARKAAASTDEEREALAREEEALRDEGVRELLAEDMSQTENWWWLSFADASMPEGEQFLGVAIVRGGGVMEAALNARLIGANPGGEVQSLMIPAEHVPAERYRNRLLSKEELEEAGLA